MSAGLLLDASKPGAVRLSSTGGYPITTQSFEGSVHVSVHANSLLEHSLRTVTLGGNDCQRTDHWCSFKPWENVEMGPMWAILFMRNLT